MRLKRTRGLTLIELAVAVAVLSLGTLAAIRAQDAASRSLGQAMPRLLAGVAAENRAQELRLAGAAAVRGLPGSVTLGGFDIRYETTFHETAGGLVEARIRAVSEAGPGALLTVWLPPPGTGG